MRSLLSFEEKLRVYDHKLNESDLMMARFILDNKEYVAQNSIQVLAKQFFTVPNTLVRFSKKLEYGGFSELKSQIKNEVNEHKIEKNDLFALIAKTYSLNDQDKLYKTARAFKEAKSIWCFGIGDNAPLCEALVKRFKKGGALISFPPHRHEIIAEIKTDAQRGDVAFFISVTGESLPVLEAARVAREKGVFVISLTHFSENPLADLADLKLYCENPRRYYQEYTIDLTSPLLFVIEMVWEEYYRMCV